MVGVGLPRIPLSGIRGVVVSSVGLTLDFMLILPRFLAHLASCMGPGCRFTVVALLMLMLSAFLGSVHWPADAGETDHFGVSNLEVLILFEQWAGHRLLRENVTRAGTSSYFYFFCSCVRRYRNLIRQGCQFITSLVRGLGKLHVGWQVKTVRGW